MIKVLFVDDETDVLEGLENRLHQHRDRWQIRFALGADAAIKELRRESVDVIVSDMRMPGMDGGQLLDWVRERHPETVRILLSGQTGTDGAIKAMPVAHQMLTKPCDLDLLERAIECGAGLQGSRDRPEVSQVLGLLQGLPALPRLYWDLVRELDKPNADSASVAKIIEQDMAMTARVLQMSNSAFFASARSVRSVRDAITALGLQSIRAAVLQLHLFRAMSDIAMPRGFSLEKLQTRSLHTAWLTNQMLANPDERKTAYSAAVLHDVGYLVLAVGLPEASARIRNRARSTGELLHKIETEELGCDHAQIGARMLALWGLPVALVEAVAYHNEPMRSSDTRFGATAAVHVASVLSYDQNDPQSLPGQLDLDYLRRLGVEETVLGWQEGKPITRI
jgi:HD-like signal output (HDOD) protein/ActR/RegA family two-component response regulator